MSVIPTALQARAVDAAAEAQDMFWEHVAAMFPEAKTGDFSPEASHAFTAACSTAVESWVIANVPPVKPPPRVQAEGHLWWLEDGMLVCASVYDDGAEGETYEPDERGVSPFHAHLRGLLEAMVER